MKIIGSYVSPYVRKVLACLALKELAYEIDPITPFYGNEEFGRLVRCAASGKGSTAT
jgi:glutathione S-transferase